MSVNVVRVDQAGKAYEAMTWLYLASLWSADQITLGGALAAAPARDGRRRAGRGFVVKDGRTVHW